MKAITFDFWGTLIVDGPMADERYKVPRLEAFRRILAAAGRPVSMAALATSYDHSQTYLRQIWNDNADVSVERHVEAVLAGVGLDLLGALKSSVISTLVEAYAEPMQRVPPAVDPSAFAALTALCAQGYRLAIISNVMRTPGRMLRQVLDGYGLLGFFTTTTFSDEVGIRKPAREIFALTLATLATPAQAAVHVGDDLILDVMGAQHAGLRVVYISDTDQAGTLAVRPDRTIASLADLPDAITELEQEPGRR